MIKLRKGDTFALAGFIEDGTVIITVPTPRGWKCKKKGCPTRFRHTHSTYSFLTKKPCQD